MTYNTFFLLTYLQPE